MRMGWVLGSAKGLGDLGFWQEVGIQETSALDFKIADSLISDKSLRLAYSVSQTLRRHLHVCFVDDRKTYDSIDNSLKYIYSLNFCHFGSKSRVHIQSKICLKGARNRVGFNCILVILNKTMMSTFFPFVYCLCCLFHLVVSSYTIHHRINFDFDMEICGINVVSTVSRV